MDIPVLTTIGLGGLGIIFFLSAYKPLEINREESDQIGFNEMLGWLIVPKVLWIGTAVSIIGILFYALHLNKDGYIRMLYIGGGSIITATLVMLLLMAMGIKYMNVNLPIYLRAIPAPLIVAYLLYS